MGLMPPWGVNFGFPIMALGIVMRHSAVSQLGRSSNLAATGIFVILRTPEPGPLLCGLVSRLITRTLR